MASLQWNYFVIFLLVGSPATLASGSMETNDDLGVMVQDLQVFLQ